MGVHGSRDLRRETTHGWVRSVVPEVWVGVESASAWREDRLVSSRTELTCRFQRCSRKSIGHSRFDRCVGGLSRTKLHDLIL